MKTSASKLLIFILILPLLTTLIRTLSAYAAPSSPPDDGDLLFSTYLGGELTDSGAAIAVDQSGNVYVTGATQSTAFPGRDSLFAANHGVDLFVAKITPEGGSIAYLLWLNAASAFAVDEGFGIAVDDTGYAYVAGHTRSPDFCSFFGEVPGYDTTYNENNDAFLLKVKTDGSGLVYCTYLGGSDWDAATAVIIDEAGNATITGETWSTDFPTTANAFNKHNNGQRDIFVANIDSSGTKLTYSSYIGGSGQEKGSDLVDMGQNQVALTGWTNSTDLPTPASSFDPTFNGAFDAFLFQLNLHSGLLTYGSYLGSAGEDRAAGIDVLDNGQILLGGTVEATADVPAPAFPTTPGAVSHKLNGNSDAFVAKFNRQGSALAYSSLLGGSGREQGLGISADEQGTFALSGSSTSTDFPTTAQAFQAKHAGTNGAPDAFITQFDVTGSHLLYSSYLGGGQEDKSNSVLLAGSNQAYVTGSTRSEDFPVSLTAPNPQNAGDYDIFVSRLTLSPLSIYNLRLPIVLRG